MRKRTRPRQGSAVQGLLSALKSTQRSMRYKLSLYMALLAAILIFAVCIGLFSFGRLSSPKAEMARTLQTQMDFFRDDMRSLWQNVATSGVHLSTDMTYLLEECLEDRGVAFSQLTGDLDSLTAVEDAMLEPLCQYIRQTRCSGGFVVLDAAMRTDSEPDTRSGLYIQKNNAERSGNELLLFRGMPGVSKAHGVMPHRKWQQEMRTDQFPGYAESMAEAVGPIWESCRITELITLPGTSERAIFLTVPMVGEDGTVYGICGFAVNQTYFCAHYEQPSDLDRLACLFTENTGKTVDVEQSLVTYTADGSCTLPDGALSVRKQGGGIWIFSGSGEEFIGKLEQLSFTKEDEATHTLAVLMPKEDFDKALLGDVAQVAVFGFLLLFFVVACCIYFARRYLRPVYEDMKRLQTERPDEEQMTFDDFEPLTATITAREETHKALVTTLEGEKATLQSRYEQTQTQLEVVQADAKQLATRRKDELDPAAYEMFLLEYRKLSDKQRLIIDDMVDGLSPQESADHLKYQKSTVYSYRRDIYDRLHITGKDKLQQLRLRVALLRQNEAQEKK